jgi:tRNA A-37 threonylcarbamoyl transferase component Bud32
VVTAPDIPGHRVGGVLGSGGFATVYRAWQLAVGREVAVKVDNRVLLTERDRRRFFREVTAAGRLSGHPHVIDVYDAGTLDDGRPYLVMELCPAGSLNDVLRGHGPMAATQVRDTGIKIADALAAAHQAGVLHRDIKPANILVNRYGVVGLSDFGLASIIAAGEEQTASRDALTPAFSAPESFRGETPTALADIYALAATLYALLTGRPPSFGADGRIPSLMTIMALHDKPVDDIPGTSPEFMALLRRSLAPDPAARPQTAAAFRDALAAAPGPATAPSAAFSAPPAQYTPVPPAGQYVPVAPAAGYATPALHGDQPTNPTGSHVAAHWTGPGPAAAPVGGPVTGPTGAPVGGPVTGPTGAPVAGPVGGAVGGAVGGSGRHAVGYPSSARHRPTARLIGLAAVLVVIGAAVVIAVRLFPHHAGTAAASGTTPAESQNASQSTGLAPVGAFGIATVQAGCPAASVRPAEARCPASPECWAGLVEISGVVSAEALPCDQPHYWETFAIAIMPAGARTFDQPTLAQNPTVRAVCSLPVLLASRRVDARRIPASSWQIEVLPPTEAAFDSGTRTYRCVADVTGSQPSTSQFRR